MDSSADHRPGGDAPQQASRQPYRETLHVPVGYWLLSVPVIAVLGAELFAGFSGLVAICVYAVFVVVVGGFLLAWGATRIEVRDGVLRAGGNTLPLTAIAEVLPLDPDQVKAAGGPRADPAARLLLRPYLKRGVYIGLAGGDDGEGGRAGESTAQDAPYWLIATRRPEKLAAALTGSPATVG